MGLFRAKYGQGVELGSTKKQLQLSGQSRNSTCDLRISSLAPYPNVLDHSASRLMVGQQHFFGGVSPRDWVGRIQQSWERGWVCQYALYRMPVFVKGFNLIHARVSFLSLFSRPYKMSSTHTATSTNTNINKNNRTGT